MRKLIFLIIVVTFVATIAVADEPAVGSPIPKNAKVFITKMTDDFDTHLRQAFVKKNVPVQVVEKREDADFEISGTSESVKAGTAKKLIMGSWHSDEQASIRVVNLKTSEIAYAYSAVKQNSTHGKRSTAEAIAKHLKEKIESGK